MVCLCRECRGAHTLGHGGHDPRHRSPVTTAADRHGGGRRCGALSAGTILPATRVSARIAARAWFLPARTAEPRSRRGPGSAPDAGARWPPRRIRRATPRGISARRSWPSRVPPGASASRSPCCSATSCAPPTWPGSWGRRIFTRSSTASSRTRWPRCTATPEPSTSSSATGSWRCSGHRSRTRIMPAARCWRRSASPAGPR